ncbi:MAG: hypothetical protein IJD14_01290 [Christensenellaceae bacterium]|nr:hypothetical protein [Christensenellaceae bacterium]
MAFKKGLTAVLTAAYLMVFMLSGCVKSEDVSDHQKVVSKNTKQEEHPAIDILINDVEYITYNDNSAPPDTPVSTYTDKDEMEKILDMFSSLSFLKDAAFEEAEPGNYSSYTVYFTDGTSKTVQRTGSQVYFEKNIFSAEGFYHQLHKDCAEIYIEDMIFMPEDKKIRMYAYAYDESDTFVTSLTLKWRTDHDEKWKVLEPHNSEFTALKISELSDHFDLADFKDTAIGYFLAEFELLYPSGKTETKSVRFHVDGKKPYYSYRYLPSSIPFRATYVRTDEKTQDLYYPKARLIRFKEELDFYYRDNCTVYDLEARDEVLSDSAKSYLTICENYDEDFFIDNQILLIAVKEGSGSNRHEVTDVILDGDPGQSTVTIKRLYAQDGTADEAVWHIFIEIDRQCAVSDNIEVELN